MALRDSKLFLVFAWGIAALALASFAMRVVLKVTTGTGGETYTSGTGVPWHYTSALVVLVAAGIILGAGFVAWAWRRIRRRNPGNEA